MRKFWACCVWLALLLLLILAVAGVLQNQGHDVNRVLALLIGVTVVALGGLYLYGRRSLPRKNGRLSIPGVSAPVEIIRDVDAVPHIYARNKLDAFFGLGFVHAQDRLWQMDFERHKGYGRLAEILGPSLVSTDRFLRTLGAYRTAQDTFQALPVNVQEIIKAYVAGINAFLYTHKGARLPPEFTILAVTPEPWSCYDVVVWQKMIGWNLGNNFWTELLRRDLVAALGFEGMQQLTQDDPGNQAVTTRLEGVRASLQNSPGSPSSDKQAQSFGAGLPAHNDGAGSNAWAVNGSRHTNTRPILACDPHLGAGIPSNWYLAHLVAPDLNVIGATLPGLPAVVVGRNSSIAWGITNLFCDVQDLFRERLDPAGAMAEYEGQGEPVKIITETIRVKGKPDVEHQIRFTRHGPLISDVLNSNIPEPLALSWTGFTSQDISIAAFIGINEAQNWDEFTASLARLITPTLNFIYADTDGNIGYHAAGRVPIRKGGDGTLPAEGWSGQAEWQAWIPFHQLPHTYNPPEHYLVNANNCPISDKYPYFLGCQWAPSYRAQRITGLIQEHEKMSLHDHMAIQGDTVSLQAREYLPHLLPAVQPESPEEELAIQLLTHWDHNMQGDSPAATIFAAWLLQLPKAILENILEEDLLDRYQEFYTFTSRFLLSTLLTRSKGAPAGSDPAEPDRLEQAIANAFRAALKLLRKRLGGAPDTWRWSRLHTVVLPHQPFHKVRPLRLLFSRTVPQGGDWSTVNCGAFNPTFQQSLIAGYRQIIDLSNQDGSVYIQTSGQSGHLLSPHYDDYLADWKNIHYRKMRFTRSSVSAGQRARLWLTPHPAIPRERMTDLGAADHQ